MAQHAHRRKHFCQDLKNIFKDDLDEDDINFEQSKASYILSSIKTFLQQDENFYALELMARMEEILNVHMDNSRKDPVAIAILFLLTNKKEKFKNTQDEKIKMVFNTCPYGTIQQVVDYSSKLKSEFSDECKDYIFKNKLSLKRQIFNNVDYEPQSLSQIHFQQPKECYYYQMREKVEKKIETNTSFSMSYTPTADSVKAVSLADYFNKFKNNLPGFILEEFTDSIMQKLSSDKSSIELQNELFEMLGFDAFELISELLDHREAIIKSAEIPSSTTVSKKKVTEYKPRQEGPAMSSQIVVHSEVEKSFAKQLRKIEKKERKTGLVNGFAMGDYENNDDYNNEDELAFMRSMAAMKNKQYPNVYDEQKEVQVKAMVCGQSMNIPKDAVKKSNQMCDEITIHPKKSSNPVLMDERMKVEDMDKIGHMIFKDIETFNVIQTKVYPIAYHTNENMLISAPTGAGKTNIALLTIVQQIKNFLVNDVVRLEKFKIVYICPMKALAAEMASNFSKKLMPLGVTVKECTGDMQLTRKEISETQMLVTTPEKWDVITRKGTTDAELTSLLKLLIIDEVHLLNSDRGPVIEALVARTLRQVVNSQNMIRIVGLSATLPNYVDVAHFLRVNLEVGLFYFDSRFRSVPLTQTFIGIKSIKQMQQNLDLDEVCFDKVVEFLRGGHQVMVFVHARNQTTKTANYLKETAQKKGVLNLFEPSKSFKAKKATWGANNKSLANFLPFGLGVHHAGMLRKDRNEVEKCFLDGAIKVLCCTATLAWGVNLPAHGVIIKGTKLYDSKKGTFIDLDILDVMQIFGRAGRPQFDSSGHGIIITTHDKLHFYLSSLTNQIPIESKLLNALTDNLNAEVVLGSVSSIAEAVEWLTFTYLHRRMRMNPQVYGLQYSDLQNDPNLHESMLKYVEKAAILLDKARMIRYDPKTGDLTATNLGRTASYYYINFVTVEAFNDIMSTTMSVSDIINMMCFASEFQQIQVRQEEMEDLDQLAEFCELTVPGGVENVHGKVNILMQTYLSRGYLKTLSLASDMEYITQSAARIARALFDIAIHQNSALLAANCLLLAQMFEQRLWDNQTPMRQFKFLEVSVLNNIETANLRVEDLREMDERQIGQAIRNVRLASKVQYCAFAFPTVDVEARIQPITRGVIRIKLFITPTFKWSTTYHGKATEMFWVWIEDPDNDCIYHTETINVTKNQCAKNEPIELIFTVPLVEPIPSQYLVRISSDRWMNAVSTHPLPFNDLQLPQSFTPHTDLLELQPLEISALGNPQYESLYSFGHFNPVQTQIFHCLYHTDNNVLLGAPTGSGKTIAAEICIFRLFNMKPELKVVYIAPLKALVRERVEDWKKKFGGDLRKKVIEITGDITPSAGTIASANIIITTPEKWDGMSRGWQNRNFIRDVGLMIIDEIHLLGEDRGPVLEVIVSRTNFISDRTGRKLRIIGLSTAMANARDLATWLGIGEMGLYNFRPSVRPVPLEVHIAGFPGKHYCPRMMSMNRPAYQAIRQHAPDSPSLVFCSSRKQTRLTAFDLITYLVTDSDPKQWLHCDDDNMELILSNILDPDLKQFLSFGIGIHHAGLQERDRKTVEELFVNQKIQVLIATGTLAWGVNFPAHLVVIKGTEYFDGAIKRYVDMPITDVLQMMGRAGRPQFDTSGVACVFVHDIKKNFYKKFLYEPFPVESNLRPVIADHINAEIAAETIPTKRNLMEYLTWTYFFRRLLENPSFYGLADVHPENINDFLSDLVDCVVHDLADSNCVQIIENEGTIHYESTFFGQVSSYYYLSHKTMLHFQENLKFDCSIIELLSVMCHATEYALFPVRHNEDKINMDLAKRLNLKLHGQPIDSPHVKVYILLHMYLGNLELPNQEYIVDCKSVMDQALRILQAMVDVTANAGWLSVTIKVIHIMQMLIQGMWITDPDILTIPHVSKATVTPLLKEIDNNPVLRQCNAHSISGMLYANIKHNHHLRTAIVNIFGSRTENDILKYLKQLPWVEVKAKADVEVKAGEEFDLSVEFWRNGNDLNVQSKSRYAKRKDEGWFLCVGYKDELCGIKRVSIRKRSNASISILAPNYPGNFMYTVYLLSDCYLGLDQQFDIPVQVKK